MKSKIFFSLFPLFAMMALSACATITGVGKDNTPPPSALVSFKSSVNPKGVWSTKAGQHMVINGNAVFVADEDGKVTSLNLENGKVFWKTDFNNKLVGGIGVGQSVVVVANQKGDLFALDQSTGKQLWQVSLGNQVIAAPLVANNMVIAKTLDGQVYALNSANGASLWKYSHGSPMMVLAKSGSPQVVGDKVIAGYPDGKLEAYRAVNGKLIWENQIAQPQGATEVEQMIDVAANPEVSGNTVYAVTYQGNLTAINASTGRSFWQQPLSSFTGLTFSDNTLYVTDAKSVLWAFDRASGRSLFEQDNLQYRKLTAPYIMNNWIVVGDGEGYVHWLNPRDGVTVGRVEVDSKDPIISLAVENNSLYVATKDGVVKKYQV